VIQSPDGVRTEHFGFIQAVGTNNIAELTAAAEYDRIDDRTI
jgi:ribonuclease HI